jgi:hypothetical protein
LHPEADMKPVSFAFLALFALACGGPANEAAPPDDGAEVSEAELRSTPLERAQALVAVLNEPNALQIPPRVQHDAEELRTTVELVDFQGSLLAMLEARFAESLEFYGGTAGGGLLSTAADPDTRLSIQIGFEDEAIKQALKTELVAPAKRASVTARLPRLVGTYARVSVVKTAAELLGEDVILLRPRDLPGKVIVVRVHYFHG